MPEDWSSLLRPTARSIVDALLAGPASFGELAAKTGFTKAGLQRPLGTLERLGVVSRTYRPVGPSREVVYALEGCSLHLEVRPPSPDGGPSLMLAWAAAGVHDPEFPLANQVPKPTDRRDVLTALRHIRERSGADWNALFIVLFGSTMRGESNAKSDIDLLLVLPEEQPTLREKLDAAVADAQTAVTLPVQPFFTTRQSFLEAKTRIDAVAAREGVVVHGDPRERELWNRMTRYRNIST